MPTSPSLRALAGRLAVALLRAVRTLPPAAATGALAPLLPAYIRLRRSQARRLEALFAASPFPRLTVAGYYRRRLDLLLRSLRLHGSPLDRSAIAVDGAERYRAALATGRPVVLVGLHMGVVELLHRLPEPAPGRPFRILTAGAFAPALTAYLREGRERDGKAVLANRNPGPGLREVLSGNGVLALMADQAPAAAASDLVLWDRIRVPWPARLLAFLAERGCLLLPVSTWIQEAGAGEGGIRYRFHAPWELPLPDTAAGGRRDSLRTPLAGRLRAFLEDAIAAAPEQWNWSYPGYRPIPAPASRK